MLLIQVLGILLLGLTVIKIFKKIKIPSIITLIFMGLIIGESGLNLVVEVLEKKTIFINLALTIILFKAGLGIEEKELKKAGRPAILLGFIPCILEGTIIALISYYLIGFPLVEAFAFGFIIAAVSPAILVPLMVDLKTRTYRFNKHIPIMNLAAGSIDDVVAITIFSIVMSIYTGTNGNIFFMFLSIPVAIILALLIAKWVANLIVCQEKNINSYMLIVFIIGIGFLLMYYGITIFSPLILMLGLGYFINHGSIDMKTKLEPKVNVSWEYIKIILFVIIGAQVDIKIAQNYLVIGLSLVTVGLLFRFIGVYLSLIKTQYTKKEKCYVMLCNIPKATVQASLGAIPLTMGMEMGEEILAVSVIAIIYTVILGLSTLLGFEKKLLEIKHIHPNY